jgi:prepilin-type processing-associated H-X9-DG protein
VRSRIFFFFCFVAVLLPSNLFAQALADRVPADAVVYFGWKGADDLGPGYAQSHLKAMLDASNVAQLIHETIPQLIEKYGNNDPQVAEGLQVLDTVGAAMWRHPSALFIGKIAVANGQPQPPHLAILCQAGADSAALLAELQDQLQKVPSPLPTIASQVGDLVVLAVDYGPNELKLPAGNDGQSLAENAGFKTTLAEVGTDPVLAAYIDAAALVKIGDDLAAGSNDPKAGENWPKLRDQLGLGGLKAIAFGSGFDGKDWGTRVFVAAPQPRSGLLGAMDTQPLPDELLTTIPQSATLAGAGRFDLAKFVEALRSGVAAMDPNSGQQIDNAFQMISESVGVDIQKELLPTLGDEWAYYVDPLTSGKSMSGIAVINHLRDPAQAQATLEKFEAGIQQFAAQQMPDKRFTLAFRKTKIGDTEVNYLAVPLITPAWTIQDGYLCMGLYPQVAASAAQHIAVKGKSILDNEPFAHLRKHLGGEQASSIRFMDLRATAPDGYATWRAIASLDQFADVFGVASPPTLMPPLNEVMAHLSAAGQVSWSDAAGWHVRSVSPFPGSEVLATDPSSMGVAQEAMVVSILLPALNRAREQANRVKSASNLRQIGLASVMYSNEQKDGSLPSSLGIMVTKEDIAADCFVSPRRNSPRPPPGLAGDRLAQWVDEHSDYVWVGKGKKNTAPSDEILAYEKPEGLRDGINILYCDGHVEFRVMADALQQIENAKQSNPHLPRNGGL